jgi:hypothetical protein
MSTDCHARPDTTFTGIIVYGVVALWFAFAYLTGSQGRFAGPPHQPPIALGLAVVLPIAGAIMAYRRRGAFWAFCQTVDLRLVVVVHAWRLMAVDFLFCCAEGRLPATFAIPAGVGDIVIGLGAIPLALALRSGKGAIQLRYAAWNALGLIDLILAIILGILCSPSSLGLLAGSGPTTQLMSELPRSMTPTFLVPLFILLHCLALARRNELVRAAV